MEVRDAVKIELGENEVFLYKKIRLLPTPEQEIKFWKSAGVARWAYNFFLSENKMVYACTGRTINNYEVRSVINNVLKPNTHKWLSEVGSNVMKQAVKDAEKALIKFFNHKAGYPRFKSKHKSQPKFYVNYENLKRKPEGFIGEKLGIVRTVEPLPKLKIKKYPYYYNTRISYDGKFWYLTFTYVGKKLVSELTDNIFGIDLGIKELAVLSNQDSSISKVYANINKTKEMKRLERKLKRAQRKHARKILQAKKQGNCFKDCKNLEKQRQIVALIYRKLTNIRNNYIFQIIAEVVKAKPKKVVMEDLNVAGMLKNKYLAKSIADQKWAFFRRQMEHRCEINNIDIEFVPRFYPSSKTCSCCGNVKKDLKLSDRTYICSECGLVIDRDLNASINLANYAS